MTKLNASTRLKVKKDTFYLPDQEGGVYFRNNESSFRIKGSTIYQWVETLMPMFNGEQTMAILTEGLTPLYKKRVYEIGETLYQNGFVRDISKDRPHQLNPKVLEKYSSQIEFIESFVDSGAYHFQKYRQSKILAVGSGPILVSLVSALIESGHPKFHFMLTRSIPTNLARIQKLVRNAQQDDSEVDVKEVPFEAGEGRSVWKQVVQPYDLILYVSQDGNVNELRSLNFVCKEEKKVFLPAICFEQVGLAGPVVHQESDGCWESAWHRLHQSTVQGVQQPTNFSSTTGSILANVLVFELFKKAVGISGSTQNNQIYLLNLETLEGNWLSFITHPLVTSRSLTPRLIEDLDLRLKHELNRKKTPSNLLEYFSRLTSEEIGILHSWEERNLTQLPLSQCYVQAVTPLTYGPAALLPEVVCAGFTHEEAKRHAGLTGIEMYVSQLFDSHVKEFINQNNQIDSTIIEGVMGIGAGQTIEEAVCRGLKSYLEEELSERKVEQPNTLVELQFGFIEDQQCRYYLDALTTLHGPPTIDIGEGILGFPVIRIRANGRWYTSVGLNTTLALRSALEQALLNIQNEGGREKVEPADFLEKKKTKLKILSCDGVTPLELLQSSIQILKENKKRLVIYDLSFEPFLIQELAGVFGVQVREEEF